MKKFCRSLVFSLTTLIPLFSSGQTQEQNVLWQDDFSKVEIDNEKARGGWRLVDIAEEKVGGKLRIRESGAKSWGKMYRYLPFDLKDGKNEFLQIKLGDIENFENYLSASNISSGGEGFGKLFSGWNTFDLSSRKGLSGKNGTFALGLVLRGVAGTKPGGWLDLELVRTLSIPYNGLTMKLLSDSADKIARVGDRIMFKYYSPSTLSDKTLSLKLKLFISPLMHEYKISNAPLLLNDKGLNGDEKADDGIYSLVAAIDENALTFKSESGSQLIAVTDIAGVESTGTAPFECDIKTKSGLPLPIIKEGTSDAIKYRRLWLERTAGENLAKGKKIKLSRKPSYRLTQKGGTDLTDLTDGILTSRLDGRIWFDGRAVGWYKNNATSGINCLIDLEKVEPVGRVVVRALGGKCQGNLSSPGKFEVFVSKDGVDFYKAASMQKLMPGEKSQSDFKNYYYLDEDGRAFVYPFQFQINADARYVGVSITGETDAVFADEIAVIKAVSGQGESAFNGVYKTTPQKFHTEGIIVAPRTGELALSRNIDTPNVFWVNDMRSKEASTQNAVLNIDLPESAKITFPEFSKEPIDIDGEKYFRWSAPLKKYLKRGKTHMIFIEPGNKSIEGKTAYFSVDCKGIKPVKIKAPIKLVDIPVVSPEFKKLHIGLAWMSLNGAMEWPDFFKAWKVLGFNSVACFPRWWKDIPSYSKANPEAVKKAKEFLEEARKNGMKIVMNESPFHVMEKGHKAGSEIFSETSKPNRNLCPSYKGEYYRKEMERVADCVRQSNPDYVFWDIECWYPGAKEAHRCKRCIEGRAKSGKDMDEYLKDLGAEKMKDLYEAVKKGSAGRKMPLVGSYNHHAAHPVHSIIMDFNRFYPGAVDMAMPSLYVVGRALDVHNSVRKNYELIKAKKIIPWLSAGCYGEFEPYKLEQMVLEAFMNGANGITYYCYYDFDTPMDFYYHAKALAEIAPYEDLIVDGEILEPEGSNKDLTYSGIKKGDEMLLLIGNYKRTAPETEIKLPFGQILEIKDLRNGKTIPLKNPLAITVPKGDIILYWIKGK